MSENGNLEKGVCRVLGLRWLILGQVLQGRIPVEVAQSLCIITWQTQQGQGPEASIDERALGFLLTFKLRYN